MHLAESRFQPRMLPRFLDELFGPDETLAELAAGRPEPLRRGHRDADHHADAGAAAEGARAGVLPAAGRRAPTAWCRPRQPAARAPRASPRARALALGLAGALIIGAFTAGLVLSNPPPLPELPPPPTATTRPRTAPAPTEAEPPTVAPAQAAPAPAQAAPRVVVPEVTHPPAAQSGTAEPGAAIPPVERRPVVSVRIESDPPGAEVSDIRNRTLGVTPLVTTFPRGMRAVTIILNRPGYETTRHTLHLSGNLATVIKLRPRPPESPATGRVTAPGGEERPLPILEPPP